MTKDGTLNTLYEDYDSDFERKQECDATTATAVISLNKTSLSIKHFGGVFSIHAIVIFVSILYTLCAKKRKDKTGVHQENTKERNDIFNDNKV